MQKVLSLINPKGLLGALCIKVQSLDDTMLYHHSITQKMSSEKATEEFPRVLPLKIIIQNLFYWNGYHANLHTMKLWVNALSDRHKETETVPSR